MVSKIIELEKERQICLLRLKQIASLSGDWRQHKQSLINLKEYMKSVLFNYKTFRNIMNLISTKDKLRLVGNYAELEIDELEVDIDELNKMIEKYGK